MPPKGFLNYYRKIITANRSNVNILWLTFLIVFLLTVYLGVADTARCPENHPFTANRFIKVRTCIM